VICGFTATFGKIIETNIMANQLKAIKDDIASIEKFEFNSKPIKGYPELKWTGKRPFRSTQYYPAQLKEIHGAEVKGWMNELYWGDNLQIMSHLLKKCRGSVDLVYIDPPFDSKADYKKKIKLRGNEIKNDLSAFEEKQYSDMWTNDEYLQFMYERLILIRELLNDNGSIFLHCDWHKSHYLRCLLDELFGPSNFRNEIIWYYPDKFATGGKSLDKNHDIIFHYSKGDQFVGNDIMIAKVKPSKRALRKKVNGKTIDVKDEQGNKIIVEYTEKRIDDVWLIPRTIPVSKLYYPTQKKEELVERIIEYGSNEGDLVFDCFMGSGTTQAVAMKLGRRFIGADINLGGVQIATKRLINLTKELVVDSDNEAVQLSLVAEDEEVYNVESKIETFYTGFSVFNVNNYDIFRNPIEARELLIEALEVQPYPSGSIWDGEKDGRKVKIMPINRIATKADLNEIIANIPWKEYEKKHLDAPAKPVDYLTLVCMGHEPDLAGALQMALNNFKIDVEVVDILRDKTNLEFKRDSEAKIEVKRDKVVVRNFFPMNLLQKLSLMKKDVEEWRELVDSVMIDFNYDGAVFTPTVVDVPEDDEMVSGEYDIPDDAGNIKIKITDLLSETYEKVIEYGNQ
jgi:DNA modification methylase